MRVSQEQQKKMFEYHLQLQQRTREHKMQQKRQAEAMKKNPEEHMLYIQKQFKTKAEGIEQAIKKYKEKAITFYQLMELYANAKEYYVAVSYALKTYDRQIYKEQLDKMYNTIVDLKRKHEPRQKFKFSRRQEDFGVKADTQIEEVLQKQSTIAQIPGLENLSSQTMTIAHTTETPQPYKILWCNQCDISVLNPTQILFLKNLKNTIIRAGVTKSTVFVDNCENCIFQLNCHQLRIHNCYDTTFHIFVTSKAIIEDCDRLKFAQYRFHYQHRDQDEQQFGRKGQQNMWREIQDFNWLKENIQSPHYQLIDQ